MNICNADAIAHLGKWFAAGVQVRVTYRTISGSSVIVGTIKELSPAAIKIAGNGCEMNFHFRDTSEYDYKDVRQSASEDNKNRASKYPVVISVKFSNGGNLDIVEFFED